MSLTRAQAAILDSAGASTALPLGGIIQSLQQGKVAGAAGVAEHEGFDAGAITAALRSGTVTGTVASAGTPVNTAAVPAGVTPTFWIVNTGPVGASVASYSGGAGGTFSVNASATGAVSVRYFY